MCVRCARTGEGSRNRSVAMADDFVVRPLAAADVPHARDVYARCDIVTSHGTETGDAGLRAMGEAEVADSLSTDLASFETITSVYKAPGGEYWVLQHVPSGDIIGSVALEMRRDLGPDVGELRRMCVDARFRRRGLASRLLATLQDYARARGVATVFLTTPAYNVGGIATYRKGGFDHVRDFVYPSSLPTPLIESALSFVGKNWSQEIDFELMAKKMGVGYRHFRRMFQEATGLPPHQYLLNLRLNHAKRLLGMLPVSEVAARVGFADPLYFSRLFKRKVGVAPTQWH